MVERRKNEKDLISDERIEKIFDTIWENWASRRRCEKTHTPNYLKELKSNKKNK
ncbi:MAG: hypothetical protein ACTSPD_10735 [Promethearchaeota archaeon]